MDLNQACFVVDGRPLPAKPWQPDFVQGLYAETYHALLNSAGMYPIDWSNGFSAQRFVGDTMLLPWDLRPDDSDGMAYLSPRCLGTVEASLRFTKPVPTMTTLLTDAQYDNLVVVDAYCTVTFDYSVWCSGGNFRRPSCESPRRPRHWLLSTLGKNPGPFPSGSWLPTWPTFNEYDFPYNDQTPPGIGHTHIHPHIYSDNDHGFSVDRLSTPGDTATPPGLLLVFIAMDTPPSSCSPPSSA